VTRAALYLEGKTPYVNDRLANLAISGDMMSVDSLSKDTVMTSSGDDFCGSSRITSATLVAVTVSKYERDDELVRVMGGCNTEDVDANLSRTTPAI